MAETLTPEQHAKHRELYVDFVAAANHALEVLGRHGMDSAEFREADRAAGVIANEINKLLGRSHWMG